MEILIVIAVVVVVGGLVVLGFFTGRAQNPPTVASPGGASADGNCRQACARWDTARQMQCNSRADEAAARSRADAIRNQMLAFIAAATSLTIAGAATLVAAAAATATFFGIPAGIALTAVAIGLFVLAAAATASAAYFAGQLVAAEADVGSKAAARQAWDTEVASARAEVNARCSPEEANACLTRTAPC